MLALLGIAASIPKFLQTFSFAPIVWYFYTKVKGLAQMLSSDCLEMLGFEITTHWSEANALTTDLQMA